MSEFSTSRCHRPLTPRRLDLLVPRGWESDSEAEPGCETGELDEYVPPHDIMEAFLVDIEPKAAPPPRFAVPKTTQRDTTWCISLWNEWRDDRNSRSEEQVPSDICALSPEELRRWLSRFVLEVRKMDGKEYCPDTLYHIVCGVMRFLRQNGKPEVDLLKEQCYADFRSTLDAEMRRLKRAGMGSRKRQAEPLTPEEEELLWEKCILGDHSPQALLNSVFFFNGVCFALRSGDEHRRLRFKECQIQVVKPGERVYLMYTEDSSKNNQGGLKGRKLKTK